MKDGIYYLNNAGHRWVVYKNGRKETITLTTRSGVRITRTAIHYEMFGNFAVCLISYKGKKMKVFPDTALPD
jgi:hypothetical protein